MSASSSRKKRLEQANLPVSETPKKKKKLSQGWIFAICIILVVALLIGGVLIYRAVKNNRTVLTVGDHDVSVKEFNYFYNSTANNLGSYASYVGIESGTPLDKQYVTSDGAMYLGLFGISSDYLTDKEPVDGTYDVTWAQLIASSAKDTAVSAYAIYNEAMTAGYEIDEHLESEIDEQMDVMQGYADTNGESLNHLIERVFGSGCNAKGYRDYLTVMHVAQHYPAGLRYEDDKIAARYDEDPDSFTVASYYLYSVSADSFVEADEDGNKPDPTDAEKKQAEDDAKAMEKDFDIANEKVQIKSDNTRQSVTNNVSEDAAAWIFDKAKDGDVKLFENEATYFVVKLIDKSDYQTLNGLEIVIEADSEELAEGEQTAAEKVEKIKASLEADASEANFRALMEEYGAEGEDLEDLTRASLASVSNDVLKWSMEERKAGDYVVAEVNGATIILYCTGLGENYSKVAVTSVLTSEWSEEMIAAAKEACGYDEAAALSGNVSIAFN
ncbi:MAG: hypothetical protein CW335_00270 [Clostridiales bacterium]|nr:hypothetical protein [Clostridiales bacterium]